MQKPFRSTPGLIAGTLVVIAFGAGVALSYLHMRQGDAAMVEGLLWPDPPIVSPVHLLDHDSAPFTLDRLRGKWTFLFFVSPAARISAPPPWSYSPALMTISRHTTVTAS